MRKTSRVRQSPSTRAPRRKSICFEVQVNDEPPMVAGAPDINVLVAAVTLVASRGELGLRVGGLTGKEGEDGEHREWIERDLEPGDRIAIRILPSGKPAPPTRRHPS